MIQPLLKHIERVFLGKTEVVRLCLTTFLAGEHLLLEDIPGVGKTLLAKALAKSIRGKFARIQFTPDLLPAEITGSNIYASMNWKPEEVKSDSPFRFIPGPLFANIVLADEINRTTPRTQSAMLEAMGERCVTCDGITRNLPEPFFVIATQNPMEYEGTYPLPESQLDRFLMRISIGYPSREWELKVLETHQLARPIDTLEPLMTTERLLELQQKVKKVLVDSAISHYILDLIEATRQREECLVGVSTRGALALYRAAQAYAFVEGRDYVTPDDVKALAVPVLSHRILLKNHLRKTTRPMAEAFVQNIVENTLTP
ncbi:MAG: MoxR family ATPase [Planctomycetia bacterium]|nr:MoxR family ATPase [Planctomycetia bacterium]